MVKVVEQGLCAKGRADVRQLVMWAVDIAAGKEVDGVVLPRPKLRAATQEWVAATDTEVVKVVGVAAEGTVTATAKQIEAAAVEDEKADETAAVQDEAVDEAAAVQDGATDEAAAAQDVETDKAPKAPADLIARVAASIKQKHGRKQKQRVKTAA